MFGRSGETKYKNVASEDIVDDHDIENEGDAYVDHHRQRQQVRVLCFVCCLLC